jgi:hypothetical protein
MWKSLIIVFAAFALVAALLVAIAPSQRGAAMLAFGSSSPDQSTGPYNPNSPLADRLAQGSSPGASGASSLLRSLRA